MTECKLPLDAKSTACRGKPNSQTVITEPAFCMKVQYYHWSFAWSVGAVTYFSWNPVFLCQWQQRNWAVFKHVIQSFRQSICLSWPFFLRLTFPLSANCRICETILVGLAAVWVRYAELAAVNFPRRLFFFVSLWQASCASLLHFSSEVHRTAASVCPRGFPY